MANPLSITLLESTALSASGSGDAVDIGALRQITRVQIELSAVSGTLTVFVESRPSDSAPWAIGAQIVLSAVGTRELYAGPLSQNVRARWTLSSGGTATVGISGEAHVVYCVPADINRFSVPANSLDPIAYGEQLAACIAATDETDGYVGNAFDLPLTAWGEDLRKATARIAGADLLSNRGIDPEGQDAVVFQREEKAHEWLNRLANGRLSPPGIVDQTPTTNEGGSYVTSGTRRGW